MLFFKNEVDLAELQIDVFCDKATYSKAELLFLCCSVDSAALSS